MKKLLVLATTALISAPTMAGEVENCNCNTDYLTVGAGYFDAFDNNNPSAAFSVEYKAKPVLWNVLRPVVGGLVNSDGALYGYAGMAFDFEVGERMFIIPHVAVGAYEEGSSFDLGGTVQFKSGVEFAYELENKSRIGLSLDHISNGGIYDRNPGTETVMLTYSLPFGSIFGKK